MTYTMTKTRIQRLRHLNEMAVTSNEQRGHQINIAYKREIIKQLDPAVDLYMIRTLQLYITDAVLALKAHRDRIYVGSVDTKGIWGRQLCYLKVNNKGRVYFYIENLPSGWALSQVINSKLVTIEGGQKWEVTVDPETWDNCKKILSGMNNLYHSIN